MTVELVEKVVNAVLYEGYMLYPYRSTTTKNRQRFTFGRVYPQQFSEAQRGAERATMQTQCLIEVTHAAVTPTVTVDVRFLQPLARDIGRLSEPLAKWQPDGEMAYDVVPVLQTNGRIYQSWQEATEQSIQLESLLLSEVQQQPRRLLFTFPAVRKMEPIYSESGQVVGVIVRRQAHVEGQVEVAAEWLADQLFKVTVRILNLTPLGNTEVAFGTEDEAIILRTFASTHTVLTVQNGAFVSLMNPAAAHTTAVAGCENDGTWPVLVGDEAAGQRDTLLSSPIILYDYPEIAAESAGDLFDGTEIDEILTLRIMTMTDEEKGEMRQIDERARQILQRTEAMTGEHLMQMHGTIRGLRPLDKDDT